MRLKQIIPAACLLWGVTACGGSSDDPIETPVTKPSETPSDTPSDDNNGSTTEPDLSDYVAPTYVDWYRDISEWSMRSKWNLSNVHDPSVVLADDGYYYMYQTDASFGGAADGHGHFHARRSKNLVDWEYMGGTMPRVPSWVSEKCNALRAEQGLPAITFTDDSYGCWAPCVRKVSNGKYRMYYSIVINHTMATGTLNGEDSWAERGFIGMMETTDPSTNNWVDKGFVTCSSTDRAEQWYCVNDWVNAYYRWNAIDPSYIITPEGEHWLIHGSWHSGIVALQLDPETGKPLNELGLPWGNSVKDIASYGQCIYTREMGNRWQGSEGPEIVYRNGYYYLFLAYDALAVPYNTRVVRSTKITGPYYGIDGLDCTTNGGDAYPIVTHPYKFNGDPGWVGISHCAVFDDGHDNWFFASQGRLPEGAYGDAWANYIMLGHVRRLIWTEDGWPVVLPERYGNVPQVAISESEIVGTWENIDLSYSYGNQKTSTNMVFGEDHKITSGSWAKATWSFDPSTNVLTLSNGLSLIVRRETDWESSTRRATLVYAAINGKKTYWGKKN
jgi:beta-xylosidase